jgi:hypothetical protein
LHDRQPEAKPVACCRPPGLPALERLQQAANVAWRDRRAGVGHAQHGGHGSFSPALAALALALGRAHAHPDLAVVAVVAKCVVDEVGDGSFRQCLVADHERRRQGDVHGQAARGYLRPPGGEHVAGDGGEVDRVAAREAALAPGQGEQRVDEPFLLSGGGNGALAGAAQDVRAGVGAPERHLQERA